MYAHQVIEDLKSGYVREMSGSDFDLRYVKWARGIIENIQQSQSFYVGESLNLMDLCTSEIGKKLFKFNYKLPYNKIWIDGLFNNNKFGLFVEMLKDTTAMVILFTYHNSQFPQDSGSVSAWVMHPMAFVINIAEITTKELFNSMKSWCKENFIYEPDCFVWEYPLSDHRPLDIQPSPLNHLITLHLLIMLLNCKNITTKVIKAPETLNKKRRKNGKQEIFDYHVLNVSVPSKKGEYREKTEALSHVRVHLCRGHFKEYTEKHPLFGRLTGLYWWQPHVRGQNKEGIVMKDYKIKTQEAEYGQIGRP